MSVSLTARLDRLLADLPRAYPGPGGAVAALQNGEVLVRHAWGWANAERRIEMTDRYFRRMVHREAEHQLIFEEYLRQQQGAS